MPIGGIIIGGAPLGGSGYGAIEYALSGVCSLEVTAEPATLGMLTRRRHTTGRVIASRAFGRVKQTRSRGVILSVTIVQAPMPEGPPYLWDSIPELFDEIPRTFDNF